MICNPEYETSAAAEHKLKDVQHKVKDVLIAAMERIDEEQKTEQVLIHQCLHNLPLQQNVISRVNNADKSTIILY